MERKRNMEDSLPLTHGTKVAKVETGMRKTILVIDTNKTDGNVTYTNIETTDYYRRGRPYKLFPYPATSMARITFRIDERPVGKVELMLNHCRTNCHAIIDILINDKVLVEGFQDARWENFGEQNFLIPAELFKPNINEIVIRLNRESPGVYWLSDLKLDIEYI